VEDLRKIKTRRTLVGAAWACVGVLGMSALTGVAVAAENSRAASSTTAAAASAGTASGAAGRGGLRALGSRVLHGELTVKAKNGVRTVDTQLGTVTSVSPTSLTVRSQDGFSLTWVLGSGTVVRAGGARSSASALAVGQSVRVLGPAASSAGGSPTARLVRVRPAPGSGPPPAGGGTSQAPASPSASTT
jgi:hypothetical protein